MASAYRHQAFLSERSLGGIEAIRLPRCQILQKPHTRGVDKHDAQTRRAVGGLASTNSVGTTGAFVGPAIVGWLKDTTGSYDAGIAVMAGFMAVATLLALSLKLLVKAE
jgi:nitrate/nitrite transporter NarK